MAVIPEDSAKCFVGQAFLSDSLFCALTAQSRASLDRIKHHRRFKKGSRILEIGQTPGGIFLLRAGRARYMFKPQGDGEGEMFIRFAEPDEILGLTEMLAGRGCEVSLETLSSCDGDFIEREDFIRFLLAEPDVCFRLLRQLGLNLQKCCQTFCDLCHKTG